MLCFVCGVLRCVVSCVVGSMWWCIGVCSVHGVLWGVCGGFLGLVVWCGLRRV